MSAPQPAALLEVARAAAEAGAAVAARWRERADALRVEEKTGPGDLVSQADREAEDAIRAVLSDRRPDDAILGEEHGTVGGTSGVQWLVDPVDGTTNYLYGRADWAVSVAAAAHGRVLAGVVIEPALGRSAEAFSGGGTWADGHRVAELRQHDLGRSLVELNLGRAAQRLLAGRLLDALVPSVRDVRRGGSAACALAQVATGRADAVWAPGLQPWDCAAGILLVTEAGGTVGDLRGATPGAVPTSGDVLACSPGLWESLRVLLEPVYRDREPAALSRRPSPRSP